MFFKFFNKIYIQYVRLIMLILLKEYAKKFNYNKTGNCIEMINH